MEVALAFALGLVAVALCVVVVASVAERFRVAPPLALILAGILISFIPGIPSYTLSPELVLVGILPPLLFSAAYNTSFIDFRANRRALISLSVGLVIFTTVVVGYAVWWALPGLSLAAGFAIGAIVAPPDAVAATAVARRVGMPRSIVRILEGESLVNDATALTALGTAILAMAGTVTALEIGTDFLLASVGGVVVGVAVSMVAIPIRKRLKTPAVATIFSFTLPYLAYVPAEKLHASGILAVVVAGLLIGHKAPITESGGARLMTESNWRSVSYLLENAVFFLIGMQLRQILQSVSQAGVPATTVIWVCAVAFIAVVVSRLVWVYGDGLIRRISPIRKGPAPPWRNLTVVGWAGMRGVVTLAAALSLPESTPYRPVLVLVAFVVVVGSISLLGSTLPWIVRQLKLAPPDPAEDALAEAALLDEAMKAGLARLDEASTDSDPDDVLARLRVRTDERSNSAWERVAVSRPDTETPIETYQRLRLEMLAAEREAVLAARDAGRATDEALRRVIRYLDVEEAMLDRSPTDTVKLDHELATPPTLARVCDHLLAARDDVTPKTPGACEECLDEGTTWVHLRLCLTCGHVGCCDSSVRRHATGHFHTVGHPVMRSAEPNERWRWCYSDEILG